MIAVPAEWAATTLGALGRYLNGRGFKQSEWAESGRPIIRIQNLTGTSKQFNYFSGGVEARYVAQPGDLLVSWAATLGAFIWPGPEAVVNQHIFKVESNIDVKFHKYLLDAKLDDLMRETHGSGMVHITRGKFDAVPVLIPPVEEQRQIVDILEDHLSRLDAADAYIARAATRPLGLLESFLARDRSLHAAMRLSLEDLLAEPLRHGRSVPTSEEGFPVLRLTAIRNGRVDLNARKVGDWAAAEATPFLVERGDFLVARGNGSLRLVGRGGLVTSEPDQVAYPDTAIRVRVRQDRIDSYFLALVWDSREVRAQIERRARTTAGIFKINQADMRSITVPVPSLAAQDELVDRAMTLVGNSNRLTAQLSDARSRSTSLRRALLRAAFSGQLIGCSSDLDRAEEAVG